MIPTSSPRPSTIPTQPNPLAGDYNLNGTVDAADYVIWRKTLGATVAAFSGADGDGDGMADEDDHGVWRTNFGRELPAAAATITTVAAAAAVDEAQARSAISTAGEVKHGGSSTSSGSLVQLMARDEAVAVGRREALELFPSPARLSLPQASLKGKGTARVSELRVAEQRETALDEWMAMRARSEGVANDDIVGPHRVFQDEAMGESPILDALDEAFASCGVDRFLSAFQGFVMRERT